MGSLDYSVGYLAVRVHMDSNLPNFRLVPVPLPQQTPLHSWPQGEWARRRGASVLRMGAAVAGPTNLWIILAQACHKRTRLKTYQIVPSRLEKNR